MRTAAVLQLLRQFESPNVTFIDPDGGWPIVWKRARGVHVWDADGRKYLDLTAAFGVAAAGHGNARVVAAARDQMARLLHAMGDVHPHEGKARLARDLSRLTFERWGSETAASAAQRGKVIFGNSGFEAVEAALKTAFLASERRWILAFSGAYHGLGYGALNATHREHFRSPFRSQLGEFARFVPFPFQEAEVPAVLERMNRASRGNPVGAVIVEPIQARGGIRVPPGGFLSALRQWCHEQGALLIFDEIYTGFGRTGDWFACEFERVVPDLICLGKALTGGFPLSACIGRADVMDAAWPVSTGEAIHTSTFLGNPVGCAMALAQIAEIHRRRLVHRSRAIGAVLVDGLNALSPPRHLKLSVRGRGLMIGAEFAGRDGKPSADAVMQVVRQMLRRGFILLPEGEHSEVLSFTPPLVLSEREAIRTVRALQSTLDQIH